MLKCRCGNRLDSKGYCHECQRYAISHKKIGYSEKVCDVCNMYFTNIFNYMDHRNSHPQCELCRERFSSEDELRKHIESNHKCLVCNEYYNSVSKHLVMNHPYCELCNERFLNRHAFGEHMKVHPICEYCGKNFSDRANFDSHVLETHKCHVCHENFIDPSKHISTQHFFCYICNCYFIDEISYEQHNQQEHTHQCIYCDKVFKLKKELEEHAANYHKCNHCDEYFSNAQQHFIDEHYYCERCRKPFFSDFEYKGHLDFHEFRDNIHKYVLQPKKSKKTTNNVKNYVRGKIECQFCLKTFASEEEKHEHIKALHSKSKKK